MGSDEADLSDFENDLGSILSEAAAEFDHLMKKDFFKKH